MSNKPRPSLLELFDPLLENAINTPVPESPPGTPCREDSKEDINGLTMTAFFNHISKSESYTEPYNTNSDILIDIENFDGHQARTPLRVKETTPVAQRFKVEVPKESFLTCTPINQSSLHPYSSNVPPLQDSPSFDVSPCDAFLPVMTTDTLVESQTPLPKKRPNPASTGLAKADRAYSWRRRSSIDISAALSSISLNVPDLSFDLLNGDISFLSKSSERDDSNAYMRRGTPNLDSKAEKENIQESSAISTSAASEKSHDISSLDRDCDILVNEPEPNALAAPLSMVEVVGSQLQYENQQSTPPPIQKSAVMPAPVKKLKVFTSHRKTTSTDDTTANFNRHKQHAPQPAHQIRKRMLTGGSVTRGAGRVPIDVDKDASATAVVPTIEQPLAKRRLPMLHSDVLPPRTHIPLVSSNAIPKLAGFNGISKSVPIATGTASRLPAPVQMKGRVRPVSKTGLSGIAKSMNRKP